MSGTLAPELLSVRGEPPEVALNLHVPQDLFYFRGHFPGAPVLPGVVQLHWAVHFGGSHLGVSGRFGGVEVLKFQRIIEPQATVVLSLRWDPERSKLYFEYRSGTDVHSTGRIVLA